MYRVVFSKNRTKVLQKMHIRKQSEHFLKNNRFYLLNQFLCYSLEACLHKSGRGADSEGAAYFSKKNASDAVVWAAFRERSYEGEEVPRMALRVQRPTSPHLED